MATGLTLKRPRIYKEIEEIESLFETVIFQVYHKTAVVVCKNPVLDMQELPKHIIFILSTNHPFHAPTIYIPTTDEIDSVYIPYLQEKTKYIEYQKTIKHCNLSDITMRIKKMRIKTTKNIDSRHMGHPDRKLQQNKLNINERFVDCLYCNNFITTDWSPVARFYHIIYDIRRVNILKRMVKYELALDRLKIFPEDVIRYIVSFLQMA